MIMDKQLFRQKRLQQLIADVADGKQSKFADLVDIASTSISRMLYSKEKQGSKAITEKTIEKIEKQLGLPAGWFDAPFLNDQSDFIKVTQIHPKTVNDDALFVPIRNVSASMGHGIQASEFELVVDNIEVSRAWLKRELPTVTAIKNLQIISGVGDSMSPTYQSGDLLLVDTGITDIKSDLIYVFSYIGETFVKRISIDPVEKIIIVKSDNPKIDPWKPIPLGNKGDLKIHGRVIYAWHGNKL